VLIVAGGLLRLAFQQPVSFRTGRIFLQIQVRYTRTEPSYQAVCVTCCATTRYVRDVKTSVSAFFVRRIYRPTYSRGAKLQTQKLAVIQCRCREKGVCCARGTIRVTGRVGFSSDSSDISHSASTSGHRLIPTSA
jgi:hypothetical protein